MKVALHLFNVIYNILFRIIAFMASFYTFSSLLFLLIPYSRICNSDYMLLLIFVVLCFLSYAFMKKVVSVILRSTK